MSNKDEKYRDEADDWWNDLPREIQNLILKAERQLNEGKGIPHEEVMKKYSKWLTK